MTETQLAQGETFAVTGVTCATNYAGTAAAATCATDQTDYVVSGCVENVCVARTDAAWASVGCTVADASATTVSGLGAIGEVAGFFGTCTITCQAGLNLFQVAGMAACTPLADCDGITSCTTDATTGQTCDNCAAGKFEDDANNACSACTALADCDGTTSCTTDATTGQTCDNCAAGFFEDDANNACSACTALADCGGTTSCTTDATTGQTCDACDAGFFEDDANNACSACTALTDCDGTTSCTTDATTGRTCDNCAAGTFEDNANNACTACTALDNCGGTTSCTTDATTGRTCDSCDANFFADDANNRCAPVFVADSSLPTGYTGTMTCTAGHDVSTCSGVTCDDGYSTQTMALRADATTAYPAAGVATSVAECCVDIVGMCSNNAGAVGDFTCPTGYEPKRDAAGTLLGSSIASAADMDTARRTTACCDRVYCAASDCSATTVLLANAATTLPAAGVAVSESVCCEDRAGMCTSNAASGDDYTCPTGYTAKSSSESIASAAGDSAAARTGACCDRVFCAASDCSATTVLRANAATTLPAAGVAADTSVCCEDRAGMCTSNAASGDDYSCPTGYAAKSGSESVASAAGDSAADRTAACCDRVFCTAELCLNPTKTLKPNAATTLPAAGTAVSTVECCDDRAGMCSGNAVTSSDYTCPVGYTDKSGTDDIASASTDDASVRTAACCERVFCTAAACSATKTLIENAETTLPSAGVAVSEGVCCENRADVCDSNSGGLGDYTCPTGYTPKAGWEDITSDRSDDAATRTATCCDRVFCDASVCLGIADTITFLDGASENTEVVSTGCVPTPSHCTNDPSTDGSTYTVSSVGSANEVGDTMAGTCKPGYDGTSEATCSAAGSWEVTTECSKIDDFCTNDPLTVFSRYTTANVEPPNPFTNAARGTNGNVGDTISGFPRPGAVDGLTEATCTAISATEGRWVVTTGSAPNSGFCGSSTNPGTGNDASSFVLPTTGTDQEIDDLVVGTCNDGYEGQAVAACGSDGNFAIIQECTACPVGKAGTGGTCDDCSRASCTATDQNDAAAVTLCEAVALDGFSLTCTSAGPCSYTEGNYQPTAGQTSCLNCATCGTGEATLLDCLPNRQRTCECRAGYAGSVGSCTECAVETCAAINTGNSADVTACDAVVLDGHAATCTGIADPAICLYTAGEYSRFSGSSSCTTCTTCDAGTQVTDTACSTTNDRTCKANAANLPGATKSAGITTRLGDRNTDTTTQSSTKRAATRTSVATDRARVESKAATLDTTHAAKRASMAAKRASVLSQHDATVAARVAKAANLDSAHAAKVTETNNALTAASGRVTAAMSAKDTEAARVKQLRADQLEQHAADTTLLASQRARFATAAAAQQQQLASTQDGVADVAQEVLDAENFVSTSQANAGYGTAMPSVGRRLLGEL